MGRRPVRTGRDEIVKSRRNSAAQMPPSPGPYMRVRRQRLLASIPCRHAALPLWRGAAMRTRRQRISVFNTASSGSALRFAFAAGKARKNAEPLIAWHPAPHGNRPDAVMLPLADTVSNHERLPLTAIFSCAFTVKARHSPATPALPPLVTGENRSSALSNSRTETVCHVLGSPFHGRTSLSCFIRWNEVLAGRAKRGRLAWTGREA